MFELVGGDTRSRAPYKSIFQAPVDLPSGVKSDGAGQGLLSSCMMNTEPAGYMYVWTSRPEAQSSSVAGVEATAVTGPAGACRARGLLNGIDW